MTMPAYSEWYHKRYDLTLNVLDTVIFIFIVFDDLKHFQKIRMIAHLCIKWYSLAKNILYKNEQIRYQLGSLATRLDYYFTLLYIEACTCTR